jgi:hypothetical protein
MKKLLGLSMIFLGATGSMFAGAVTPEIDASTGAAALALVSGGLMVLRSRRAKK